MSVHARRRPTNCYLQHLHVFTLVAEQGVLSKVFLAENDRFQIYPDYQSQVCLYAPNQLFYMPLQPTGACVLTKRSPTKQARQQLAPKNCLRNA